MRNTGKSCFELRKLVYRRRHTCRGCVVWLCTLETAPTRHTPAGDTHSLVRADTNLSAKKREEQWWLKTVQTTLGWNSNWSGWSRFNLAHCGDLLNLFSLDRTRLILGCCLCACSVSELGEIFEIWLGLGEFVNCEEESCCILMHVMHPPFTQTTRC